MIASASPAQYERALDPILADDAVDSVLVIFIPPLVTKTEDVAAAVRRAVAARPGKPVLGIFMSAKGAPPLLAPIPCFPFPESAAVALARAAAYGVLAQSAAQPRPDVCRRGSRPRPRDRRGRARTRQRVAHAGGFPGASSAPWASASPRRRSCRVRTTPSAPPTAWATPSC